MPTPHLKMVFLLPLSRDPNEVGITIDVFLSEDHFTQQMLEEKLISEVGISVRSWMEKRIQESQADLVPGETYPLTVVYSGLEGQEWLPLFLVKPEELDAKTVASFQSGLQYVNVVTAPLLASDTDLAQFFALLEGYMNAAAHQLNPVLERLKDACLTKGRQLGRNDILRLANLLAMREDDFEWLPGEQSGVLLLAKWLIEYGSMLEGDGERLFTHMKKSFMPRGVSLGLAMAVNEGEEKEPTIKV